MAVDFGNVAFLGVASFIGVTYGLFLVVALRFLCFIAGYLPLINIKSESEMKKDALLLSIAVIFFFGLGGLVFSLLLISFLVFLEKKGSDVVKKLFNFLLPAAPFGDVTGMLGFMAAGIVLGLTKQLLPDGLLVGGLLLYLPGKYGSTLLCALILLVIAHGIKIHGKRKSDSMLNVFELIEFMTPVLFFVILGTGQYIWVLAIAFLSPTIETISLFGSDPETRLTKVGNKLNQEKKDKVIDLSNAMKVVRGAAKTSTVTLNAGLMAIAKALTNQAEAEKAEAKAEGREAAIQAEAAGIGWKAHLIKFFTSDYLGKFIIGSIPLIFTLIAFVYTENIYWPFFAFGISSIIWIYQEKKRNFRGWALYNTLCVSFGIGFYLSQFAGIWGGIGIALVSLVGLGLVYDNILRDIKNRESNLWKAQIPIIVIIITSLFLFGILTGYNFATGIQQLYESTDFSLERYTLQEIFVMVINLPSDYIEEQRAIFSGDKYTSEVDSSTSRPVGVQLDFEPVQDGYTFESKMSVLGRVKGAYLDPALCQERCSDADKTTCQACTVKLNCGSPEGRTTDAKDFTSDPKEIKLGEGGVLFGTGVDCSFVPIKQTGSIVVDVTATYDFVTKSYMPLYFVSQAEFDQAFRQSQNFDISAVKRELISKSDLPTPVAKSSPGPVLIGLESGIHEEQPIVVASGSTASGGTAEPRVSTIGFTIQNFRKDDGKITKIEKIEMYLPTGLALKPDSCGNSYKVDSVGSGVDYENKWMFMPLNPVRVIERFETVQCRVTIGSAEELIRGPGITQGRIKVSVFYDYEAKKSVVVRIKTLPGTEAKLT